MIGSILWAIVMIVLELWLGLLSAASFHDKKYIQAVVAFLASAFVFVSFIVMAIKHQL